MHLKYHDKNTIVKLEWDIQKSINNFQKHGLSFEDAVHVLQGRTITFEDSRQNYGETRYITLGELEGRVVILVHTTRNDYVRIISMRKANEREKKIYYERLEKSGCYER